VSDYPIVDLSADALPTTTRWVRNDDGDLLVDAPLRWISPEEHLTLDKRPAAEEPELGYTRGTAAADPAPPRSAQWQPTRRPIVLHGRARRV
jgi:hypothetical protein